MPKTTGLSWIQLPTGPSNQKAGLESVLCWGGDKCLAMSEHRASSEITAEFEKKLVQARKQLASV